uniref:C2H2-type domain-containing protein n=1 Tax=Parascaris equorum TaxID=6256 RepID=A0A914R0D5_PAREQ
NARNRRRLVCCSICGKAFGKCSDLVRHYRIHSGCRPFSCNRCEKSFSLKSSLKLHLENHVREDSTDNYYTSARCPVCMKQELTQVHVLFSQEPQQCRFYGNKGRKYWRGGSPVLLGRS